MRVFQIINSFGYNGGGAERLSQQLHETLQVKGIDMHLVALQKCETAGLKNATSLGLANPYGFRAIVRLSSYLRKHLKPDDILHVHLFPCSFYIAALARLGVIKNQCIFTEHSTHNRRRNIKFFKPLDKQTYRAYSKVIAISNGAKEALNKHLPETTAKTKVVLNGCDLRFADRPIRRVSAETQNIISVGRLSKAKNYETLLYALAKIKDQPFQYKILGEGPERASLEKLSQDLGLTNQLSFLGHVEDITPHLLAADLFIIPSSWEGFGLAAVEAMNAGLPLIASDILGLKEVTGPDGDCARLVDHNNINQLSEAIVSLLNSPSERDKLAQNGFERAKQFTSDKMVKEYLKVYHSLSGQGTAPTYSMEA